MVPAARLARVGIRAKSRVVVRLARERKVVPTLAHSNSNEVAVIAGSGGTGFDCRKHTAGEGGHYSKKLLEHKAMYVEWGQREVHTVVPEILATE